MWLSGDGEYCLGWHRFKGVYRFKVEKDDEFFLVFNTLF
jgi:hypothetical protein